jgi:hypothetical protein
MAEFVKHHRGEKTDQGVNEKSVHWNRLGQQCGQFLFEPLERVEICFDELQRFACIEN